MISRYRWHQTSAPCFGTASRSFDLPLRFNNFLKSSLRLSARGDPLARGFPEQGIITDVAKIAHEIAHGIS
jgi:hypothetical protein